MLRVSCCTLGLSALVCGSFRFLSFGNRLGDVGCLACQGALVSRFVSGSGGNVARIDLFCVLFRGLLTEKFLSFHFFDFRFLTDPNAFEHRPVGVELEYVPYGARQEDDFELIRR